ncbi:MAG TPA: hypothetical protein VMN37_01280 [Gemmatimonadales bacterium]|nr:hypothetical protein [Gemmatimonadales bacterium]
MSHSSPDPTDDLTLALAALPKVSIAGADSMEARVLARTVPAGRPAAQQPPARAE